jgi:hypothetical protein
MAGWLGLAAAPVFALMAALAARNSAPTGLCMPASGLLPIDGMTAMYLLMTVFHLPPWLTLASSRLRIHTQTATGGD